MFEFLLFIFIIGAIWFFIKKRKNSSNSSASTSNTGTTKPCIKEFQGKVATVRLYESKIEIYKRGLAKSVMGQSDITLPLRSISAVNFKKGSAWEGTGYIRFLVGSSDRNTDGIYSSYLNAASDENTVAFAKNKNEEALEFKNIIEDQIEKVLSSNNGNTINELSNADEIKKFKELLDQGIISDDEYNKKKQELLGYSKRA
ncbi:DUF4429 domain-containing protein [Bacillus shivajii]|uniref:SHOCT domain-containing protein n=1 Tax=Bacillus shivajii TaxID=1983719 RepID=UPI001CFBB443|nr:SHOCT domain-containing protein [Bacillus shivajii]UCZ52917.1 DUF4429 domain-containing protein [Bacillus shivajii]